MSGAAVAKVAVVGCGWWSQGWHLPQLHQHPDVELVALVDTSAHPQSSLNPHLAPLAVLSETYQCPIFHSLESLLKDGPAIDGLLIATPHATHYQLGLQALQASTQRLREAKAKADAAPTSSTTTTTKPLVEYQPIHILMEKPMTTDVTQAAALFDAVTRYQQLGGRGAFLINHSANYRIQTQKARQIVGSSIGDIRHITAFFASPLSWIFEDPQQTGWNIPTGNMKGNGFAWGQSSHLLAWIFHVCPTLQPTSVYCSMTHSSTTGADVAHAATVTCETQQHLAKENGKGTAVLSISGTSLLPGNAHSDPPVGKRVRIEIYGTEGAVLYNGVDTDPTSGKLEWINANGQSQVVHDSFVFEDLAQAGTGPASLQSWIRACQGGRKESSEQYYEGADCELGLKTVQVLSAMYESQVTNQSVLIQQTTKDD